jgi:small-conductance mechanosensitive channel
MQKEPPPYVGVGGFDGGGYHIVAYAWTDPEGFCERRLALQAQILADLRAGNIKWPGMP